MMMALLGSSCVDMRGGLSRWQRGVRAGSMVGWRTLAADTAASLRDGGHERAARAQRRDPLALLLLLLLAAAAFAASY
jgi:hypothetical protein